MSTTVIPLRVLLKIDSAIDAVVKEYIEAGRIPLDAGPIPGAIGELNRARGSLSFFLEDAMRHVVLEVEKP